MLHPYTRVQFINELKGYGVVATRRIPMGTITWVQDRLDQIMDISEVEKLEKVYRDIIDTYTFRDNQGKYVLCWDHGKYINHSFNANCLTTPYNFEIAVRDIEEGEEFTDDYGYLNVSEPFYPDDENTERKVVYPDDLVRFHKDWDAKLEIAFMKILSVDQQLMNLISPEQLETIQAVIGKERKMDSILNCYYEPNGKNH